MKFVLSRKFSSGEKKESLVKESLVLTGTNGRKIKDNYECRRIAWHWIR
jgi:hypothetical protein